MEEIPCTIHPMKLIQLFSSIKSGCGIVDVHFPSAAGIKVSEVCFSNNYTASVTIKGKPPANVDDGKYKTILNNFVLMHSSHYANESQNCFTFNFAELGFSEDLFVGLRFILRQPSPVWQKFGIANLNCKRRKTSQKVDQDEGKRHVIDDNVEIDNALGMKLKTLYDLKRMVGNVALEKEPETFDVEGNYDINLLSYN